MQVEMTPPLTPARRCSYLTPDRKEGAGLGADLCSEDVTVISKGRTDNDWRCRRKEDNTCIVNYTSHCQCIYHIQQSGIFPSHIF